MARIRTVKPEFWTDSKTGSLSPVATKLFLGLLNHADDYGVVRWDLEEFKARIMPYEKGGVAEVIGKPLVDEILPRGLAVWFSVDTVQYLHITNFEKHQRVDKPGKPFIAGWTVGMCPDSFASNSGIANIELNIGIKPVSEDSQSPLEDSRTFEKKGLGMEGKGEERKGKEVQKQRRAPVALGKFAIPVWVPMQEWADYEQMRAKIRKPMTDAARVLAINKLSSLRQSGHPPEGVLQQSILNSWQGLFEIKGNGSNGNGNSNARIAAELDGADVGRA